MNATIGPCDVMVLDAVLEREEYKNAKVTTLGESPNAMFKLYQWEQGESFVEVDQLINATFTEKGDMLFVEGQSYKMNHELQLPPEQSRVRWEIKMYGCLGCG